MSLIRWNPALTSLSRWPSIWDDDDFGSLISGTSNNLDVYETADEVVIRANVAGVNEEDVDITFEKGVLWIKAERTAQEDDKKKKHYSKSSWSYSYKVAVPGTLDLTKEPTAEIENGVVEVVFQKAEVSKPKKLKIRSKRKE